MITGFSGVPHGKSLSRCVHRLPAGLWIGEIEDFGPKYAPKLRVQGDQRFSTTISMAGVSLVNLFQSCTMERWKPIWIATLYISDAIAQKIRLKHSIDVDTLVSHLICNHAVRGKLIKSPDHGERILIYAQLSQNTYIRAYIDAVDSDYSAYSLRTAQITSQIPIVRR